MNASHATMSSRLAPIPASPVHTIRFTAGTNPAASVPSYPSVPSGIARVSAARNAPSIPAGPNTRERRVSARLRPVRSASTSPKIRKFWFT